MKPNSCMTLEENTIEENTNKMPKNYSQFDS